MKQWGDIWKWIEEAERGDCDLNYAGCHGLIAAFQKQNLDKTTRLYLLENDFLIKVKLKRLHGF